MFFFFTTDSRGRSPTNEPGRPKTTVSPLFAAGCCVGPSTCWDREQKQSGRRGVEPTPGFRGAATDFGRGTGAPSDITLFLESSLQEIPGPENFAYRSSFNFLHVKLKSSITKIDLRLRCNEKRRRCITLHLCGGGIT